MRRCAPWLLGLALAPVWASALRAQTADQARLMFSIGVGQTSGGGTLWSQGHQPFLTTVGGVSQVDTLGISRSFRRSLDVVLSGTYFPGDHLGFNVEAQLIGLGTEDGCTIVARGGPIFSTETSDLCSSIARSERSATSVALSGGLIYRLASHQVIHPYVRANTGLLITQQSFLRTKGELQLPTGETSELTLYGDASTATLQPYVSFGGGVVGVIGRGYQFRFEVRDNWVRVPAVSGPTSQQGIEPPHHTVGKHLLTFTIGFDVVLERKRGRRY
jgi:hypothetical protein